MHYEVTASARADIRRLSHSDREAFKAAAKTFSAAADRVVIEHDSGWPVALRVKRVPGSKGVWEMTWPFSGPDGRATWEWTTVEVDGTAHPAIRWRRVGDHRIFKSP
ncbi:MAG: hypothetical protein ACR2HR_06370 [Euzebya sp.]